MKRTIFVRTFAILCLVAVLAFGAIAFSACNSTRSIVDIFKNRTSYGEFTGSKLEFSLPKGWSVITAASTSNPSDVGYIPSEDAFVVTNGNNLSIVKCSDDRIYVPEDQGGFEGLIFPNWTGVTALRVKDGLVACKLNGQACVFDMNGVEVLNRSRTQNVGSQEIDSVIKILGKNLVAVNAAYDVKGKSGYTSIFRTGGNDSDEQGVKFICRVKNDKNTLSNVYGFDNNYVLVTDNSGGDYIYNIKESGTEQPTLDPTDNGTVSSNGESNYFKEIAYIGEGRFFIHEDWTVANKEDCIYVDDAGSNYVFKRSIYTPANDKRVDYTENENNVFLSLTNNYYDSSKIGVDTSMYLKDGYTYAAYGLTIDRVNKKAYYDQFILDDDLNIVMSLTNNYGVTIKDQKKNSVGYFDLIMTATDGYYYIPFVPSEICIYDSNGKRIGHNDRKTVSRQELNNNVIIAEVKSGENSSKYGAFALDGEEIIPFEYVSLSAFRGAYTIGEKYDDDGVKALKLIDLTGNVIDRLSDGSAPFNDIATTSQSSGQKPIYAIGCYMFREQREGNWYYGIKNLNPNVSSSVIMEANMKQGSVLYPPKSDPGSVFVFDKIYDGDDQENATYDVYRLTSAEKSAAQADLPLILGLSIGCPLGVVVLIVVASVVSVRVVRNKKKASDEAQTGEIK